MTMTMTMTNYGDPFLSRQGIQIKCQQASHAPSRYGDKKLFDEFKNENE
jgi:hypothetical protein